jgi:hypothetical protein
MIEGQPKLQPSFNIHVEMGRGAATWSGDGIAFRQEVPVTRNVAFEVRVGPTANMRALPVIRTNCIFMWALYDAQCDCCTRYPRPPEVVAPVRLQHAFTPQVCRVISHL